MRTVACFGLVVGGLLGVVSARAAGIPPPPPPTWASFPELGGASAAELGALFRPMEGSLPAEAEGDGANRFVRLPCNFAGTSHDRASWDVPIRADLAVARGVQFWFYCADGESISHFSLYFRSGSGWYAGRFGVERKGEWCRVLIDKSSTAIEGTPSGWGEVDTIRLSIWRGADTDTECAIAGLGPVGDDADILVIRADSTAAGGEARSTAVFAETVTRALSELGLSYAMLSDLDASAVRLVSRKLVILPNNPRLPEGLVGTLRQFVADGGKVFAFYALPAELADLLQVRRGEWMRPPGGNFQGLVRAPEGLVGQPRFVGQGSWNIQRAEPVPGRSRTVAFWRDAAGRDTAMPGIIVSPAGLYMGHVWLTDDWAAKKQLMLALVADAIPGVWETAVAAQIARIGKLGSYADYATFRKGVLSAGATLPGTTRALAEADRLRNAARRSQEAERWVEALRLAERAADACLRAWCAGRSSLPGEHRAFWCHSAFGLPGKTWDEAIKLLADNGFTAILPNMLWAGMAYYPSEILPVYPGIEEKGDQLDLCLKACKTYGVECHVWKVNWNMGSHIDPGFVARMKAAGRVQQSFSGETKDKWLCPSHPENQALEIASMVEIPRLYRIDGIHFDYIRYPGNDYCFCPGCRERFETTLGRRVDGWPAAVRSDPALKRRWLDFRRANITKVVAAVAEKVHADYPGVKISAAVFRNWPVDRDGVGQDWKLWCDKGYLDAVCPMDYTESHLTFRSQVAAQLEYAGNVPCYPGIGLSTWSNPRDVVRLVEQIGITRELKTGGFTIFNYGENAADVLPLCALGVTKK